MINREIVRLRLAAQRISATSFARPEEVVGWLGAVQAQDYLGALWAVGLRLRDACEADVERALAERRIVRTWPMRGTLHFVATADARWMTELLAPRAAAAAAARLRSFGIDEATVAHAKRVLVKNLEGGRRLTRPAAYRALEGAKIGTAKQRGLLLLWRLAHDCVVCFGPREGKQQTFVLFEEWLPGAKRLPREEALAELAGRYFSGHGPATLADFGWWSGLKVSEAQRAVHLAGGRIVEERFNGASFWRGARGDARLGSSAGPGRAYVLPAFDEFLVGYADRSAAIAPAAMATMKAFDLILSPTVVARDEVIGTWKRKIGRNGVVCALAPFAPLRPGLTRSVNAALARYARFLGSSAAR